MKIKSVISRDMWIEISVIDVISRDRAWIFKGVKKTIKRNYLKSFGSNKKSNYKPKELFLN